MPQVLAAYNRWAERHGFPVRSLQGLRGMAWRLRMSVAPTGAWLGVTALATMINRDPATVGTWARRGWIHRRDRAISRQSVVRLARKQPWLFAGGSRSGLMQLLDDQELVDRILREYPHRQAGMKAPQPILCITTGQVFRSQGEAARRCFVGRISVRRSMDSGIAVAGLQFKAA
jgi:hypothetical protein